MSEEPRLPEWLDNLAASRQIQKRDETDDGRRISFEQLVAEVGVAWDDLVAGFKTPTTDNPAALGGGDEGPLS